MLSGLSYYLHARSYLFIIKQTLVIIGNTTVEPNTGIEEKEKTVMKSAALASYAFIS